MMEKYNPQKIEKKWRIIWEESKIYRTEETLEKPKYYCLDFFPYPSGDGLSVGHCKNYIPTDVFSRFKKMCGYSVLHPMGWDAFGQPAEQEAINKGIHPKITTEKYTANYKRQLSLIGTSYDWEREINSSHPDYYKWTQWFFLLLYKRGLAYRKKAPVNWCPTCLTVLANEEIEDGKCWRCGSEVTKRDLMQWFFKITDYADYLLKDLETIDWPEKIVLMQQNWIGRSEGIEFNLKVKNSEKTIPVFTTRPDTIYGMTFVVLAPEHPLINELTTQEFKNAVENYRKIAYQKSEIQRLALEKEKDGVFIGAYAINPMNNEEVPIYVTDYVLMTYGTGAIMAVPAHDERDFEFAKKYNLLIRVVISPPDWEGEELKEAYTGKGIMVNSDEYNGLPSQEGIEKICNYLDNKGIGRRKVNYKMRDWLISRQRYWGAPIPIIYCDACGEVPVPEEDLPVLLPDIEKYQPTETGESPLAKVQEFVNTFCPKCRKLAKRETDTMGGFACSSWYFLRFTSPHYKKGPFNPDKVKYWMPVDLYVGGAEHAVMHLLYARFWTKVMYDANIVNFREPFNKLLNQGMMHAPDGRLMSKSKGNVITPDEVVAEYSADALRAYELFLGPFEQDAIWSDRGINGVFRFLNRVWRLILKEKPLIFTKRPSGGAEDISRQLQKMTHKTIKKVTLDFEKFKFNTAVAALMEYINFLYSSLDKKVLEEIWSETIDTLMLLLAPIAPFMTEELWERTGHKESIHIQPWPKWDEKLTYEEKFTLVIQVNGKLRDRVEVPVGISDEEMKKIALKSPNAQKFIKDKEIIKFVTVPNKLINIVAK
ncbi:MAG: leucine--tRNA ligase [Actinomycetia bacterium]|nr:leucine--tRNA ligase [Actinomycetes bacterium]